MSRLSFIEKLLAVAPELRPMYEEHMTDNDEFLGHVFMGDVTRFMVEQSGNANSRPILERLLRFLEIELNGDDDRAIDIIRASFVENLTGESNAIRKLRPLMGPMLRGDVDALDE